MDMWQGSVMDGITLVAQRVEAPFASVAARRGQCAGVTASGRRPSIMMKMTIGMSASSERLPTCLKCAEPGPVLLSRIGNWNPGRFLVHECRRDFLHGRRNVVQVF